MKGIPLINLCKSIHKLLKCLLMLSYYLFIGIDISKKWIDVSLSLDGKKEQMLHSRFDNTKAGFSKMVKFIKSSPFFKSISKARLQNCLFCMEHTGVYALPLSRFLQAKKIPFHLVSPHHLKWSLGLRRGKNDKADSKDISRYIFLNQSEVELSSLPSDRLLKIKNLLSLRGRLVKTKKGLVMAQKELSDFGTKATSDQVTKRTNKVCKPIETTIRALDNDILELIQEDTTLRNQYELITSVKGAGLIIAAYLIVYTSAFKAFENSRKFATYIGLSPFAQTSGTSVNKPARVSYLAHKKLKGVISCGAMAAQLHDKELKAYYHRKIKEGKVDHSVNNAIRNKFIHRIFAVVKRGTPYVELAQFRG